MTVLVQFAVNQYQPSVLANENFAAVSPAALFGRKHTTTTGLTWGYYGGELLKPDGTITTIADGTVALTASTTNYVEATSAGVVSKNTSGFTVGSIPLYTIVTGSSTITSYTDHRVLGRASFIGALLAKTWPSDANYTLTAAEARATRIVLSGATLTTTRDLVVPLNWDGFVYNGTGGGQSVQVIGPSGTGITIATAKGAFVFGDGTNIIRASADV